MSDDFRADLHCHSTCSDGTLDPIALIELAQKIGLKGLSITDHDTLAAYQTALSFAREHNFPLLTGIEFSAMHGHSSVHVLAYGFPYPCRSLEEFCQKHHLRRKERNQQILERLAQQGMPLSPADFSDSHPHTMGRPHIAQAMVKKGYVKSIQEAFHLYIGENKPCFALGESKYTVENTIERIHEAKGLAVIAHPHLIDNGKILNDLLSMPFDGIEGYYARFPLDQQERWIKIGLKKGWIITGGSDFHGEIKPNNPLGSSWIGQETFNMLYDHFRKNQ